MHLPSCLWLSLIVLVWQHSAVQSLGCNNTVTILVLRLEPDIYLGVPNPLPGFDNCVQEPGTIGCSPPTILSNDNTGPVNPDFSQSSVGRQFVAWTNDGNNYLILLPSPSPSVVSTINMYLYISPRNHVGVPNFKIYGTSSTFDETPALGDPELLFDIINNGQLSQTDNTVRRLTLRLRTPASYNAYLLTWDYNNLQDTEWLIMSEVSLCKDPLTTYPLISTISFSNPTADRTIITPESESFNNGSLTLSCTVSNEGSFMWRWRNGPTVITASDPGTTILTTDATRTSILIIPASSGSYQCDVTYALPPVDYFSKSFSVSAINISEASSVIERLSGTATLTCEFQGHFGNLINTEWRRSGSSVPLTDSAKYSISSTTSSLTSTESYTLTLIINDVNIEDEDTYSCVINSNGREYTHAITLQTIAAAFTTTSSGPGNGDSTANSSPSSVMTTGDRDPVVRPSSTSPPIVAVVVVLIVVSVAVATAILFLIYLIRRSRNSKSEPVDAYAVSSNGVEHSNRISKSDIKWEIPMRENNASTENLIVDLYASISKDRPPSLPSRHYDDQANDGLGNGLHSPGNVYAEVRSRSYTNTTTPKLAKLQCRPDSLGLPNEESNPIYEPAVVNRLSDEKPLLAESDPAASDNLYATPSVVKKEPKSSKAESDSNIYSVVLTPAMFSHQSKASLHEELSPYGPIYAEPTMAVKDANAVKEITSSNYREVGHLGVGQFGEVVLAETVGLSEKDLSISSNNNRNVSIKVAVKMLQKDANDSIRENFQKEITFMSSLKDDNVIRLLAIGKGDKPFIMMEYMEIGDLHQLLNNYSIITDKQNMPAPSNGRPISVSLLIYAALQISSGMKYLASRNCVHRDLATRNCLVNSDFNVKIADFGMSRKLYDRAYYKVKGRAMMPIRWMATESFYGRFSEKTDVWSFGVVMWEIFTLCRLQPYGDIDDQDFIQDAVKGKDRQLLRCPRDCPQNVYDVMLKCWGPDSQSRPCFSDINKVLSVIYKNYT